MPFRSIGRIAATFLLAIIGCQAQGHPSNSSRPRIVIPLDARAATTASADKMGTQPPEENPSTVSIVRLAIPEKARVAYNHAVIEFRKNKSEKALRDVNKALEIYPRFPDALVLRGVIQETGDKQAEVERDLLAALQIDPSFQLSYIALGNFYNARGRFQDSQRILERGITSCNMPWKGYIELAAAMLGQRQYSSALNTLERLIRVDSTPRPLVRLVKALALMGLKRHQEAADELNNYLKEDPKGPGVAQAQQLLARIVAINRAPGE